MGVTDLPFERNPLIHTRYTSIRPESAPPSQHMLDEQQKYTKDYAAFLKDQERQVGPEGFLDSSKFTHTFKMKHLKETANTTGKSDPSAVSLTSRIDKNNKAYEKRMKVIEDHMWQHKQEERELKRIEGDIMKNQRAVRNTLRDFENTINKKRMLEERKLSVGMEKYTKLKRDHLHKKQELGKDNILRSVSSEQILKDHQRKLEIKKTDLARKYRTKMSEIELKRVEVMRLSTEFEAKLRQKEEEEFRLKQELGELAIALNMEVQKGREEKVKIDREKWIDKENRLNEDRLADSTVDNKLMKSDSVTKAAESSKRKLSAELVLTKSHLSIRKRDEQRHLADTQIRLEDNTSTQRQLNKAAVHAELDKKVKEIEHKVEIHNARRVQQLSESIKVRKEKQVAQQEVLEARFKRRFSEQQRKRHEDSLKFFQKMVTKGEEAEHNLYSKVRNAEYSRQKQELVVKKLKNKLQEERQKNAERVKEDLAIQARTEQELEQRLLREKAELDNSLLHSQREDSYLKVQRHWQMQKDDKQRLAAYKLENDRLIQIGSATDALLADVY
ncbi:hypothetical protein ScPMuIL_003914 [Solemya velum]